MKTNLNASGTYLECCFKRLRLWFFEVRLRFDLQHSRDFKRFCEKGGCPNLASLEEGYIQKVQSEIHRIQQCRKVVREGAANLSVMPNSLAKPDKETLKENNPG